MQRILKSKMMKRTILTTILSIIALVVFAAGEAEIMKLIRDRRKELEEVGKELAGLDKVFDD